jgi:hypothetical protein
MNVLINIDSFDPRCVIYSPPTKNKIKTCGIFYKMLYSNVCFTISSIYIHIPLGYLILKQGIYIGMTKSAITMLNNLEYQLLCAFNTTSKKHTVVTHFEPPNSYSKHKIKSIQLLLSGIWETDTKIGIVYKYLIQYKYPP